MSLKISNVFAISFIIFYLDSSYSYAFAVDFAATGAHTHTRHFLCDVVLLLFINALRVFNF